MKKTKITAALLAVSLGVTSFAAAPMTVTAENVTEAVSSAETKAEHTFEEIRNMSFDEMQTIFAERGMTFEKGYSLTHSLDGGFDFFIKPDAYMTSKTGKVLVSVSTDRAELFDESDVVWDTQKIYSSLGLSPEMFDITPSASVVMREYNEQDVMVYSRFCECDILPVTRDREEFTSLYSALYNYIQLTPDFVQINFTGKTYNTLTEVTTTAVTSTSATTTVTTSAVPERKLTKHELIANFIKENKLDAGVYELPVRNAGYTYAIVYYETDSDIPEKIKAFLKENDISESSVTFKPRKGEKPDGGMITDAKEIVRKLDECIWDNRLPAVIKIWLGGKEIFYDAYTVRRISFPVIDLIDTEKVDAIIIDCLQTDHIVYETIDEMFARENIDPSIVKYYLMQNGERGMAGDANCDGTLNMADAVLIMQLIANPDRFDITGTDPGHITVEGKANADIAGDNDGITALDALAIQKHLLGLT